MNVIHRFALLTALIAPLCVAAAQSAPIIVHSDAGKGSESTINLQSSQGAACASPVVGNCGSCSVSCPTGKAASCKPGIAVGAQAGASCVTSPECKCQ